MPLPVKVYSDYVGPYCFLAECPREQAVEGKDVEGQWVPFELRPSPQPTLRPEGAHFQTAWARSVYPLARRMGVPIALPRVSPQPHTYPAFEGYQYAKERGKGNPHNRRVLRAFFQEGQDIGDPDVLTRLAGEVGLDEKEFREALETRRYREAHKRAPRHAYSEAGISSVPTFVTGRWVLVGLQCKEALERAIDEELKRPAGPETLTAFPGEPFRPASGLLGPGRGRFIP